VDVRNSGGASLTGCSVTMPAATSVAFDPSSTDLRPGQAVSFRATDVTGLNAGYTYVIQVSCTDPAGNTISDQKSVLAHI